MTNRQKKRRGKSEESYSFIVCVCCNFANRFFTLLSSLFTHFSSLSLFGNGLLDKSFQFLAQFRVIPKHLLCAVSSLSQLCAVVAEP